MTHLIQCYGRQELFGVVWLTDGAEEWALKKLPTIHAELEA